MKSGSMARGRPRAAFPVVLVSLAGSVVLAEAPRSALRSLKRKPPDDPNEPYWSDPNWSSPIDFWSDAQNRKLHVRSLLLTENGDAADFGLRRSGDGTYPNGPPLASRKGQ